MPQSAMEEAKRRLASFAFVGITDSSDLSFRLLARTFGWRRPFFRLWRNSLESLGAVPGFERIRKPRRYPDELLSFLAEKNAYDLELYHFARGLFIERCRALL